MKIVYFGKGQRGYRCLERLIENQKDICLCVVDPGDFNKNISVARLAEAHNIEVYETGSVNSSESEDKLSSQNADLFILGGYGQILRKNVISLPSEIVINLHGGRLPDYRGSSPMNWSIINDEKKFGISVIQVDTGVDTGPVLADKEFELKEEYDINSLHEIANTHFPELLLEVVNKLENNCLEKRVQERSAGNYYPLRFPEDGFTLWDQLTSRQIHNRIRALTAPYPGAYSYYNGQKVIFLKSKEQDHMYGEPGRIYRKTSEGVLIGALDKCLLITEAVFAEDGRCFIDECERYKKVSTIRANIENIEIQS